MKNSLNTEEVKIHGLPRVVTSPMLKHQVDHD